MQIKLQIGNKTMYLDGNPFDLAEAPYLIDSADGGSSTTMVPVRAVVQALGLNVEWDDTTKTVTLHTDSAPVAEVPDWHKVADPDLKPWTPWDAPITSNPSNRSAARLDAVIKQCGVAKAPRYLMNQQSQNETYCNIFLWDVTRALGCEIPHWVAQDLATPTAPGQPGARETDANMVCDWLTGSAGLKYGWRKATASEALNFANTGKPAVVVWKNPGGIGHVAVVRPGTLNADQGVPTAQAGMTNFDTGYLADGFGRHSAEVVYYVHD